MIKIQIGEEPVSDNLLEILGFISSILGSVAWPAAAVIIAIVFRPAIARILSSITKLDMWGVSAEIDKALSSAEVSAQQENHNASPLDVYTDPDAVAVLGLPPEAIVMMEWRKIEQLIVQIVSPEKDGLKTFTLMAQLGVLNRKGVPPTILNIIRNLREIKSNVTHGNDINRGDAMRFYELSQQVLTALRQVIEGDAEVA